MYQSFYDYIEKQGKDIPKLDKADLPRNEELESLLTKVIAYSYYLGKTANIEKLFKNSEIDTKFSFDMSYEQAYEFFNDIVPIHRTEYYQNLSQTAGRAFTISYVNSIESLNEIKQKFAEHMEGTFNPAKLKEAIQEVITSRGENPLENVHLNTVLRTNTQTAYQKGWIADLEESSTEEYWEYATVVDGRETELCETLNGKIFAKSDPFWDTYFPPNHFNCRSTVIPVSQKEVDKKNLKTESDGQDYLKKSELKDIRPGNGFQYSPKYSLDKYLYKKCKEHHIKFKKESEPLE